MKCKSLFSEKNLKKILICCLLNLPRVRKVKQFCGKKCLWCSCKTIKSPDKLGHACRLIRAFAVCLYNYWEERTVTT